jgi:hypothetical protein
MVKWLYSFALLALAGCVGPAPELATARTPTLELSWRLDGFANPESAVLSADGAFLYVSNVNGEGEAEDGNGFISRVSLDGRMLEREWARGLDGPKGLALAGDTLYVADINDIALIDAASGVVRQRLPAPGAEFLNDAAVTRDGMVLVADSATQRIYVVRDGAAEIWLEHDLLAAVNGLLPEEGRIVVTTMQGRLLTIDDETREISLLGDGLGDADGVAPLGGGRYLVSEWPGLMHVVAPDGGRETILDTRAEERYLNDFLLIGDRVYQPHWEPSELSAYNLSGAP